MANMIQDIVQNLFGPRATRPYPRLKREPYPGTRGHLLVDLEHCIMCSLCAVKCPAGAIEVTREQGTLVLDPYRCIICGYCVEACPKSCLSLSPDFRP